MSKFNTLALSAMILAATPVGAKPTSEFLNDAVQGDRSESTLGSLIQSRGQSRQVRAYGATLHQDHTAAHAQAVSLAKRMHVHVSDSMMPEARDELAKLRRMNGKAFDREVRRYMIEDHTKDIAEFRSQERHGDHQTATLARQTLPLLRKHLVLAEALPK